MSSDSVSGSVGDSVSDEQTVRVLIADDQRLMREGIASLLAIQPGIEIVGMAGSGEDAISQALQLRPDVVLMDVRMPHMDGIAATASIRHQLPSCQVVMLTTFDDEEYIVDSLRAGAVGYILKDVPASDLAKAVHAAHRGIFQLDVSIAQKVVQNLSSPREATAPPPDDGLTSRELDVLRLIAQGATNKEIAEQLVISEGTVKNHITNMLSRLGLRDRTQAALYARERGLI
jgi:DNA-binding NarL/FixJ family response regulator